MLQTRRAGSSSWITAFSYELLQGADHVIADAGSMRFLGKGTDSIYIPACAKCDYSRSSCRLSPCRRRSLPPSRSSICTPG